MKVFASSGLVSEWLSEQSLLLSYGSDRLKKGNHIQLLKKYLIFACSRGAITISESLSSRGMRHWNTPVSTGGEGGEKQKPFCYDVSTFFSHTTLGRNYKAKACDEHDFNYWCHLLCWVLEAIKNQQARLLILIFKEIFFSFFHAFRTLLASLGPLGMVWLRGCFLTSKKNKWKFKKLASGLLPHPRPPGLLESHQGIPSPILLAI